MKNHVSYKYGTATTRWRQGTDSGFSSDRVTLETMNLQNVVSSSGDRKSPNAHAYSVMQWKDFEGVDSLSVGDDYNVTLSGVVGNGASDLHFAYSLLDETYVFNKALSELYEKLRGNLDLSIDVLQARSVRDMVSIEKQIKQFASRLPAEKIIGGLWLQAQYGWLPLASSIYGTFDELFRQQTHNIAQLKARSQESEVFTKVVLQTDKTKNKHLIKNDAKVEFSVGYNLKGFNLQNWTSLNPVSIAWELVPYSFVVDWIYNVGDYVRNFETALLSGKDFLGGYVTIVRAQQSHVERFFSGRRPGHPSSYRTNFYCVGTSRRVEFNRVILTAPPLPRPPVIRLDLGVKRLLSGASLLAQFMPDNERGPRQRGKFTT